MNSVRTATANSGLAKVAVQCYADTFPAKAGQVMVNQTLVLRMKFCGKNPALRVAANRCASAYLTVHF